MDEAAFVRHCADELERMILANLDIIEREDLVGNAERTGALLQQRMHATFDGHPVVGEVRGVSLLAALEFARDPQTREPFDPSLKVGARMAAACLEQGLIARAMPHGDILGFAPPLVVDAADIDDIVDRTRVAVDRVTGALVREGAIIAAA